MFVYLPLVAVLVVAGTVLLSPFSPRLDAMLSRFAFAAFDGSRIAADRRRERLLRMAAIGTPYREYVAKTYLYVFAAAFAGAVVGVYVGAGLFVIADALGVATVPSTSPIGILEELLDGAVPVGFDALSFLFLLVSSAAFGLLAAVGTYAVRWQVPSAIADTRSRQIDAGMPRMVAFVYALTRGGMAFPDVLRTLSANEEIFGEGAAEMGVAVRSIDLFSVDLVTAVQTLSQRTPSEQFEKFSENLASVLQSGRNISEFLHEQYERYREEAEEQQEEILELLATIAEVYVTTIVAGMLFLVTILLIIGLTVGDTLVLMQLIAYLLLPLGNLLFLGYLSKVTGPLRASRDRTTVREQTAASAGAAPSVRPDGGYATDDAKPNRDRLRAYRGLQRYRQVLASPISSVVARPSLLLYVTVPIALLVTLYRLPTAFVDGGVDVTVLDDLLVQAAIFLMGTFAVVYEVSRRRLRRLEDAIPDMLERLASLNEAGVSIVSSFERIRRSDVGSLDAEIERIWQDVQWGATISQALERFERRVRTPSITRVVTLITNAMDASNEIGPVLRIAAEQARSDRHLRRQRRQEMLTYIIVIYISFIVFLVVIAALDLVLIPNLPQTGVGGDVGDAPAFIGGFGQADVDAYQTVFFHTALVQATLSGLVGGMMGGGSIRDGMKHSTVMLSITYIVLVTLV